MTQGNGNTGSEPFRSMFPGGVFAYGCPPIDVPPVNPNPLLPYVPAPPFDPGIYKPESYALGVCPKCGRHVRFSIMEVEPCPWCMRAELDALRLALGDKAKPAEEIETLRKALRLALGALRDVSKALGPSRLDEVIAECEKALG